MFFKTVSAVETCSLPNRDNLMTTIHMQLSQKLKTFCSFIFHFRNLCKISNIFKKKDDAHTLFISQATACEKRA